MVFRIALLQLLPEGTLRGQLEKGIAACRRAKEMGADLALFPEMWSDGYDLPQDSRELDSLSVSAGSEFVASFGKLAGELQMAIGITFLETHEPKPLNSIILFDRNGAERLHYSKVHTCDFELERMLSAGEDFYVSELDLGRGTVRVGSMICFDREFPESARILMLKGAEVILAPNACPMEINRLSALRTRAYENMLAVATCNYPAGQPDCNGHSTVFDGVAWLRDEPGVRDMCILEAPEEEGIYLAEIDLDMLRSYRRDEVMGGKYRHPGSYGPLTEAPGPMLELVTPALEDLWFREQMLADEETMSYNHAWGGTIPFQKERWQGWYEDWVKEPEGQRYYRYLKAEDGLVGEAAYHYDPSYDGYVADVIIFSASRGRGYGEEGLKLLCSAAKANGIPVLYDDIAIDNPAAGMFLKQGFYEVYRTEDRIVLKKDL